MKTLTMMWAILCLSRIAVAFPTGTFVCTGGRVIVRSTITSVMLGNELMPKMNVEIREGDSESLMVGIGVVIQTRKAGLMPAANRLRLPGTNFDLCFDENDNVIEGVGPSKCRRL